MGNRSVNQIRPAGAGLEEWSRGKSGMEEGRPAAASDGSRISPSPPAKLLLSTFSSLTGIRSLSADGQGGAC